MAETGRREGRQQFYLVAAVVTVALIASTIGGLVVRMGTDLPAGLDALDTAATMEVDAGGPPHPALTPLSDEVPEFGTEGSVYVPVYSSVYVGDGRGLPGLAATLSIRNTSSERDIVIIRVDYVDGEGGLVRSLLDAPHRLKPMSAAEFFLDQDERRGGPGASFLVDWGASRQGAQPPLAEAIMIGTYGLRSISIVSRGQEASPSP